MMLPPSSEYALLGRIGELSPAPELAMRACWSEFTDGIPPGLSHGLAARRKGIGGRRREGWLRGSLSRRDVLELKFACVALQPPSPRQDRVLLEGLASMLRYRIVEAPHEWALPHPLQLTARKSLYAHQDTCCSHGQCHRRSRHLQAFGSLEHSLPVNVRPRVIPRTESASTC